MKPENGAAPQHRNIAPNQELASFVERIENVERRITKAQEDRREIYNEAQGRGFDAPALKQLLKDRRLKTPRKAKQATTQEIADIYGAALGCLFGTPLGDAARLRLSQSPLVENAIEDPSPQTNAGDVEAARDEGKESFQCGKKATENPYSASDPRRAAWDEGWCCELGSNSADIPESWRRPVEKSKKEKIVNPNDAQGDIEDVIKNVAQNSASAPQTKEKQEAQKTAPEAQAEARKKNQTKKPATPNVKNKSRSSKKRAESGAPASQNV